MQYVNDDMDDVFRKAAEGYPLDTTGADWNKVLAGLEGREEPKQPVKRKERRQYLLLLLLLPLGLLFNYYYQQQKGNAAKSSTANIPSVNSNGGNKSGTGVQTTDAITQNNSGQKPTDITKKEAPVTLNDQNAEGLNQTTTKNSKIITSTFGKTTVSNRNGATQSTSPSTITDNDSPSTTASAGMQANSPNTLQGLSYTDFINPGKYNLEGVNINPDAKFQQVSGNQSKKISVIPNPKRFYVGLMAGLDRTTIEFQKTSKNGFDYGVLAGYKFGRKWSVEASAFMDKKYYYTEGKYFKKDGLYMPPNSWITDVDGYCRMWDLTLAGNYSISQGRKSGWFATAGISSYIMKKENYDYTYYYATSGVSAVHSKSYSNESKNLFSLVNLSLGYTHRLGKNTDLRLEPYTKLPIKGVGVGKLSMLSAGVHIGVTHKLF